MRSCWTMAVSSSIRRYGQAAQAKGHDTRMSRPFFSSRPRLLRVFPGSLRQRHSALRGLDGLGVGCGAVANASGNTLGDAGKAEQIVGKIPVQVGDGAAGHVAIDL